MNSSAESSDLYVQSNGTSGPVEIEIFQASTTYLQTIAGSTENGPSWASWLTPLSRATYTLSQTMPQQIDQLLGPGYSYIVSKEYTLQTGSQKWILMPDLANDSEVETVP